MKYNSIICKKNLALAYKIIAHLKLDDHTYTHLSTRSDKGYYIYPFGLLFCEVDADKLIEVTLNGEIISGSEYQYNRTGYIIHGEIYKKRPDINAIFHLHTPEIIATSSYNKGLLPLSQWALHFYNKISYHNYDSLALEATQGQRIAEDLEDHFIMLMRNHGSITCGRTIQEAMFYTYHLHQACKTQVACLGMAKDINCFHIPSQETCLKTVEDLLSFEEDLGKRDWNAWARLLDTDDYVTSNILEEIKLQELIFHYPEKFEKTKQDIEKQMCDEFSEVDASGNVYTKQNILDLFCERHHSLNYQDIWEAKNFKLLQISADNYLLTYVLIQNKTRVITPIMD